MPSILYQGKVVEGQVSKDIEEKWSTSGCTVRTQVSVISSLLMPFQ